MKFFFITLAVLMIDQISKFFIVKNLSEFQTISLIPGVFQIKYVQNTGAALGVFQDGNVFFIILSILIIISILVYIMWEKHLTSLAFASLCVILGGAGGNLIDRFVHGAVIDFFDFFLINFPIFNPADIALTLGTAFLMLLILRDRAMIGSSLPEEKSRSTDA